MYKLSESDIEKLKVRGLLDNDNHPSMEAYRQVFSSLSVESDQLPMNIEKHGRDCLICGERYKDASAENIKNKEKFFNLGT